MFFLSVLYSQDIQINEVMTLNYNSIKTVENENNDWIEIYNNSNNTIQLNEYYLTDNENELKKWKFPFKNILPHTFQIIFASNNNIFGTGELNCNFKLNNNGEQLILSKQDTIIEKLDLPKLKADISYGRVSENSNLFSVLDIPTPLFSNLESNHLKFSHSVGFYDKSFFLKIENLKANHSIYYTLDGAEPTETSLKFADSLLIENRTYVENGISEIRTSPKEDIYYHNWERPSNNIDKINTLKFVSIFNGNRTSNVYVNNYIVNTISNKLYTTCISTPPNNLFNKNDGIYIPGVYSIDNPNGSGNYFIDKSIFSNISIFNKNNELILNENCDLKIQGKATRASAQKSFKVYAKKKYSNKYFRSNLFDLDLNNKYKRFVLRTTQGSVEKNFIADELSVEIIKNLNIDFSPYQYTSVYINGEYWGIQSIRNKMDSYYFSLKLDIDKDDINIVEGDLLTVIKGENSDLINLKKFINENDLSINYNYNKVGEIVDLNSYVDYQIAEMFFNNFDWPGNNSKLWKPNIEGSKWRFIFYDLDDTFREVGRNMFTHTTSENSDNWRNLPKYTFLFRNLLKNESFRNKFIKRFEYLLENDFSVNKTIESFNKIISIVDSDIQQNIDRWSYPPIGKNNWQNNLNKTLIDFLQKRPCIIKNHLSDFFELDKQKLNCEINVEKTIKFNVFPNPNNGNFNIKVNDLNQSVLFDINIVDASGKSVFRDYKVLNTDNSLIINLKNLTDGIYFIELISSNHYYGFQKFILNQ